MIEQKRVYKVRAVIYNLDKRKIAVMGYDDTSAFILPGGKLEEGETQEKALLREIKEETGIKIKPTTSFPCLYKYEYVRDKVDDEGNKYKVNTITTVYLIETDQDFNYETMKLSHSEINNNVKPLWINTAILEYRLNVTLKNGTYTYKNRFFDRYANENLSVLKSFYEYKKEKNKDQDNCLGG